MADYKATTAEFQSVANAIRTKGGTSSPLSWPDGFISAINAIPSGGDTLIDFADIIFTASSYYQGYPPENAYGSLPSNGWGANSGGQAWWEAELDEPVKITRVLFAGFFNPQSGLNWYTNSISIKGSVDGNSWVEIGVKSGIPRNTGINTVTIFDVNSYKFIRLVCTPSGDWPGLATIQIYKA